MIVRVLFQQTNKQTNKGIALLCAEVDVIGA